MAPRKVAIACQGGGTHAAFTWGVLTKILETKKAWDASSGGGDTFEIEAISGTSAGALCALATWYGLAPNTADSACGTIDKAIERLNHLWTVFAATTPVETAHNAVVGTMLDLAEAGAPFPSSSPYGEFGDFAIAGLQMLGARPEYLGFPALLQSVCPHFAAVDWKKLSQKNFRALAGAIEVFSGNFEVFDTNKTLEEKGLLTAPPQFDQYGTTRWRMRRSFSLEGVAASGTLPEILPAQQIGETAFPTCTPGKTLTRTAHYWDGLYSQNPPIRQFLDCASKNDKPDEIWVVRINPQEIDWRVPFTGLEDIRDRENDLAGNLSLNQELDHILSVNASLQTHGDDHPFLKAHKIIDVRTIKMTRETAWGLRRTSKFDRNQTHLTKLWSEGQAVAEQWLSRWRSLGKNFESYPDDARYPLAQ
ncbi:MAG: patatin-like phospholipase family protein [Defluviicoccus sp.]|nr:patatin-like phospholipase family protein [Defluviicoccus sp.]MDG4608371.1 patatin-like phospholipase family protein [Defluviicoccus sp.]